ncbi:MAG: FAD-dependent monooxygenase [Bacteroidetes bacterium]|nr:FAD-dependent monooxygenase [Bacteroidota bacterium]
MRHPAVSAVVSARPVGLTTALELARHGVGVVVLDDRRPSVNDGDRAICIARHSLEDLQQLGVAERFMQKGAAVDAQTVLFRGQPVYRLEMPHDPMTSAFRPCAQPAAAVHRTVPGRGARRAGPLIQLRWQRPCAKASPAARTKSPSTSRRRRRLSLRWLITSLPPMARAAVRGPLGLKLKGAAHGGRYVIRRREDGGHGPSHRAARLFPIIAGNPGATVLVCCVVSRAISGVSITSIDETDDEAECARQARHSLPGVATIVAVLDGSAPWQLRWWSIYKGLHLVSRRLSPRTRDVLRRYRASRAKSSACAVNSEFRKRAQRRLRTLAAVVRGPTRGAQLDNRPSDAARPTDIFARATKSTRCVAADAWLPPTATRLWR